MRGSDDFYFLRFEHRPLTPAQLNDLQRSAERAANDYRTRLLRSLGVALMASLRSTAGGGRDIVRALGDPPYAPVAGTEERDLLVQGGGAAEVLEQGRVVHAGDVGLGDVEVSRDLGREHTGSDRLLGRLAHRQIGREGQGRQQIGQAKLRHGVPG